jgi:hypothetical protein
MGRVHGNALPRGKYVLNASATDAFGLKTKRPASHRFQIVG